MPKTTVNVGSWTIGSGQPCFIIAEAGVNHNGDLELACRLVDAAQAAGADAVKFQTFQAGQLVTPDAPKAAYQRQATDAGESQFAMLKRLELTADMLRTLRDRCVEQGILFLSTPFDEASADLLDQLGVPLFKISSGDVTNIPFLTYLAGKGKPLILSTGMACLGEVEGAVRAIRDAGNDDLILLHCVSRYPADPAEANLRAMQTMRAAFGAPVGYSDHTPGIEVPLAAVALGACVIEKHFTLDRSLPGPDHRASLLPDELEAMVRGIRTVEAALGHGRKEPAPGEAETARVARRSLVAAQDIPTGTVLTAAHIALKRPGTGLPPGMRPYLIGRTARMDIPAGTLLSLEMLA